MHPIWPDDYGLGITARLIVPRDVVKYAHWHAIRLLQSFRRCTREGPARDVRAGASGERHRMVRAALLHQWHNLRSESASRRRSTVTRQQKKKRNHWVPQSYLRHFAADSDRRKIWMLKRDSNNEPQLKPIKKVATEFYLYAPHGPNGRDYSFEDKLASLEQCLANPSGILWPRVT